MLLNEYDFEENCRNITAICNVLDLPRPYIHPLKNDGLSISFGEDSFHSTPFPITTELITVLDDYLGCHGSIDVTNNSMGDDFLPCLSIVYEGEVMCE